METFSIYFAGPLFDHKQLTGNELLAAAIEKESQGRYRCSLPQNVEAEISDPQGRRDYDIKHLVECDLALFNFDGTELDSGTVVEFLIAKFLDIPAVLLRTDFRRGGDQGENKGNWNLMCSYYPRTAELQLDAMQHWHAARLQSQSLEAGISAAYSGLAARVIKELDAVRAQKPVLDSQALAAALYHWATVFPGGRVRELLGPQVDEILKRKRALGLIA